MINDVFLKREDVSLSSLSKCEALRWEMTEKRSRYDSMFTKDLVLWRHYNIILENIDNTTRHWQHLAISDNLNRLCANVISNILVLNIKGKINKIAIILNLYVNSMSFHGGLLDLTEELFQWWILSVVLNCLIPYEKSLIEGKLFKESGVYFVRRLALTNLSCDNPCSADAIDSNKVNTEYKTEKCIKK